jgi:hypothetical protein
MTSREDAYSALWDKLTALAPWTTASRKLRHWADVSPMEQPALFMTTGQVQYQTITGTTPRKTLSGKLYVYVNTTGAEAPGPILNDLLDAIDSAFAISPINGRCNLGVAGVEWARIEGTIETDEGTLGDQAVAIIPFAILIT